MLKYDEIIQVIQPPNKNILGKDCTLSIDWTSCSTLYLNGIFWIHIYGTLHSNLFKSIGLYIMDYGVHI